MAGFVPLSSIATPLGPLRCAGVEGPGPDPSPPVGSTRPGLPLARPGRARSLGVGDWLRSWRYWLRCRRRLHADQDDQRHHVERLQDRRQPVAPCSTSSNGPNDSASCRPQPTGPTRLRHTAATNSARQSVGKGAFMIFRRPTTRERAGSETRSTTSFYAGWRQHDGGLGCPALTNVLAK
jgi:hypothetical protein